MRDAGLSPIAVAEARPNVGAMSETGVKGTERLCDLAASAGRREVCPEDECPLWEGGGCSLGELLADGDLDVAPDED